MPPTVERLPDRIRTALLGAAMGEAAAEAPAGVAQLLDLCDHLAAHGGRVGVDALRAAGFAELPAAGGAGLLLRAVVAGLLSPLDRPRLRLAAHRSATAAGADEGTAMTAVAVAVLAADLCRFDLDTALVRLRQTLLEEAPTALHARLRVLGWSELAEGTGDPGSALQLAITALFRSDDVAGATAAATGFGGDVAAAAALAGALAGARSGSDGLDEDAIALVPAAVRIEGLATALAAVASSDPPAPAGLAAGAAEALARIADGRPTSQA